MMRVRYQAASSTAYYFARSVIEHLQRYYRTGGVLSLGTLCPRRCGSAPADPSGTSGGRTAMDVAGTARAILPRKAAQVTPPSDRCRPARLSHQRATASDNEAAAQLLRPRREPIWPTSYLRVQVGQSGFDWPPPRRAPAFGQRHDRVSTTNDYQREAWNTTNPARKRDDTRGLAKRAVSCILREDKDFRAFRQRVLDWMACKRSRVRVSSAPVNVSHAERLS